MRDEHAWADVAMADWQPRSLQPAPPAWPSQRSRIAVLAAVLLGHLGLAVWLPWLDADEELASQDDALRVDFIDYPPLPEPAPDAGETPPGSDEPSPEPPRPRRKPTNQRPRTDQPLQVVERPHPAPLELYGPDGRLKLPPDLLDQIDRKYGDRRSFDYQIPGMERAEKLLNRPPPITYEPTRFDEYWEPDQDLLTSLLAKMVEKTTTELRVPVPGRSNSTMVCKVSLLAFGGGCGVLTPGSDYVGPVDDPDTLSPEEDRQCQAWWEQIVGATTQDAWRRTRKLYEAKCRKPLERAPAS